MDKFIYCFDAKLASELILKGYKKINEQNLGRYCCVLENNNKINFDNIDKTKFMFSDKLQIHY